MERRQFLKLAFISGGIIASGAAAFIYKGLANTKPDISFHPLSKMRHHYKYAKALMQGMTTHGQNARMAPPDKDVGSDIAVIWSWKQTRLIESMRERRAHVLVMESGFIQPRNEWISLSWDGMNGRGKFAPAPDGGKRWQRHFAHHLKPWQKNKQGYALLIGQVPKDPALQGLNINQWLHDTTQRLLELGQEVVYRPHPNMVERHKRKRKKIPVPKGARLSTGTLAEDLAGAAYTVIYSSTTAVESILAGVPAYVESPASIAYPMASHSLETPLLYPDRTKWCHDMAWRQFSLAELRNGFAWNHVKTVVGL